MGENKKFNLFEKNKITQKGFTLVETIIYISILTIAIGLISFSVMRVYSLYRSLILSSRIDQVGITVSDMIKKDLRSSSNLNLDKSILNDDLGKININSPIPNTEDEIEKDFEYINGNIFYQEDSGEEISLTPEDIFVSGFRIDYVETSVSVAIKFDIELNYEVDGNIKFKKYPNIVILRRSYE